MSIAELKRRVEFQSLINGGAGQLHQMAREEKKPAASIDTFAMGDASKGLKAIEKPAGYADVRTPVLRRG